MSLEAGNGISCPCILLLHRKVEVAWARVSEYGLLGVAVVFISP